MASAARYAQGESAHIDRAPVGAAEYLAKPLDVARFLESSTGSWRFPNTR
jgi:hypothetical protein